MNLHEFELRYMSYHGLNTRFDLGREQPHIINLSKKSDKGQLENALVETSVEELRDFTRQTYTTYKKDYLETARSTLIRDKTLFDYIERLEYEFKVIDAMGYNTYFLIVQDYINRSKENDIVVGPGRGSCAGSILSYLIGITDIDPMEYDLIFERFLNPGRISMPDIDTDFEDTQRDKVIEYIREKYGKEKVAHIGTYMTMAAKAAFKDVARVYGVNFEQSNTVSALITEKTIQKSIKENKDLASLVDNDQRIKNVVKIASHMEGTVRQTGVHACGMIIAPEATINYTVIQHPPQSGSKHTRDESRIVSQYDGGTIEDIGLLKMDLLGLRNLSIIKNTIKIINAKAHALGEELHPLFQEFLDTMLFHPPLDDQHTYKTIFHSGNTSGVFQFESDGMKTWLKKLKPTEFDDLIAMVSLYRPGPMDYIPHYVDRKHGAEKVTYMEAELKHQLTELYDETTALAEKQKLEEDLSPFLDSTYGIAVYQEQLMRLVQAMAGFSMVEADKLRKGVGKKIKEVVQKIKIEFREKSGTFRGYKPETAVWIYEKMVEPAANYSFNKSHAACYAYISYQTAWLKAHYPLEFHAALLRSCEEETDRLAKFIDEIQMQGYQVKLPDVNTSFAHIAAIEQHIQLGLLSIKGIGSDIAYNIQQEREKNGDFSSLSDFAKRCGDAINKKSLEALIKSGALDQFEHRSTLRDSISRILDRVKSSQDQQASGGGLFAMEAVDGGDLQLTPSAPYPLMENLKQEFSIYKTLLSAHPFDGMYGFLRSKFNFISMMKDVEGFGEFNVLGMIKSINRGMRGGYFLVIEDISSEMEFFVNDKLDLKVFDIIQIKGYKGRRFPSINQINVFSYETLLAKVQESGRYKKGETVAQVRKERFGDSVAPPPLPISRSTSSPKTDTLDVRTNSKKTEQDTPAIMPSTPSDISLENTQEVFSQFPTPDNMMILAQIPTIIKQYPGEVSITIGNMEAKVDETGAKKLRKLLT